MTSPLRIAHVIGSTGVYGAEGWVMGLLRHLPRDRAHAQLVNLVDDGRPSKLARAARERGIFATDLHTGGRFSSAGIVRLARFARAQHCDILHSHGYKADALTLLAARLIGARCVSTPHGWSRERDRRLVLYESLDRYLLRWFDAVCPLSAELRDGLQRSRVNKHKLHMIMNGVDLALVESAAPAVVRRPDGVAIGYVGQLIDRKNVECLIQALAHLTASGRNCHATIVGDGPRAGDLKRLADESQLSSRVNFLGYHHDPIPLLKTFDVLALPSWEEGIPRCLMEAMAAGIPVVASDIPGSRDLVTHGATGLLFPPDNPPALAQAVLTLIDRPENAKAMARRARAHIEANFSIARMAGEYAALYETC